MVDLYRGTMSTLFGKPLLLAVCVGFGLMQASSPLSSAIEAIISLGILSSRTNGWIDQVVFIILFIGTLVILSHSRFGSSFISRKTSLLIGLFFSEVGTFMLCSARFLESSTAIFNIILVCSAAFRGVGIGILLIAWMEIICHLSPRFTNFNNTLVQSLMFSAVLTLIAWAGSFILDGWFSYLLLIVYPAVSYALLQYCYQLLKTPTTEEKKPRARIDMPKATQYIIGVFGMALGSIWVVIYQTSGFISAFILCLGFFIASLVLAIVVKTSDNHNRYTYGKLLRIAIFIAATAFLFLPVCFDTVPFLVILLMGVSWGIQTYSFGLLPIQIAEKLPYSFTSVVATGSLPIGIGVAISSVISGTLIMIFGPTIKVFAFITLFICLALIIAALVLPPKTIDASVLGIKSYMETETALERLQRRCSEVATQHNLTERETEVMLLLAQGLSQTRIADELTVSTETVKTYSKRIYKKLGVHSLREMTTLIELGKLPVNNDSSQ